MKDWEIWDRPRVVTPEGRVENDWTIVAIHLYQQEDEPRFILVKDNMRRVLRPTRYRLDRWQYTNDSD